MKRYILAFARSLGQFFSIILAIIALAPPSDCQIARTKVAGKATLPENLHSEWLRTQHDPAIPAEDRIKSTVNTFFIIKYDSWVQGNLLDFGFLFIQADPQAYEDYAYERGLMHYLLEGWKYWNNLLLRYEYQPKFYDLKVNEQEATVVMRPKAGIVHRRTPTFVDNGPWTDYVFSLELVSGEWLIRNVRCNDELHESYSHGTDFEKMAISLPDRVKEFEAKGEAEHRARMQSDPEYRELIEKRQKMIREGPAGKKMDPEKTKLAGKGVFPEKQHSAWLKTQLDPAVSTEDKVKSTVNFVFVIMLESRVRAELLDFGFLFDQTNPQAQEDYLYEKGLWNYRLEGWKRTNSLLADYRIKPRFYDLKVEGHKATAEMWPESLLFCKTQPYTAFNGGLANYRFSLELVFGCWLIQEICGDDELHDTFGRGTDFERLAADLPKELEEYETQAKREFEKRMQNDPKFREMMETREKQRQEEAGREDKRKERFSQIAGCYETKERKIIFIFIYNDHLMANFGRDDEDVVLHQILGEPYKFAEDTRTGPCYHFEFVKNDQDKIVKCLIKKGEVISEAQRVRCNRFFSD